MRVAAGPVARIYELVDGRPRTVAVEVDGRRIPVAAGPEVAVTVGGRRRPDTELVAGGVEHRDGLLAWTLTGADLAVRVVAAPDPAAGVVRTWAEVSGRGRLERVELARWAGTGFDGPDGTGEPVPYNAGPVGLGQPVFGPGFFTGIEHPMAENLVTAEGAGCALPVAVDLGPASYRTPPLVLGAGGLEEFWAYLDTLRPVPPRLVTLTNNWYHLGAPLVMDDATVRAEVEGFAGVAARHGLVLDFVALDDGWDGDWDGAGGLWGRMARSRFPAALGPERPPERGGTPERPLERGGTPEGPPERGGTPERPLERGGTPEGPPERGGTPLGPNIGLWLSPFGGYGARRDARLAEARRQGFEIDRRANVLCAAGARYRAHLVDALARWTAAGVAYWKLDGVSFTCAETDHGHPTGPGARTAQADLFAELVATIRAVRPDAVVAFTIGSHPSPWWLATVDFVWRGGLDDTAAKQPGARLDRFDTYIDTCLQAYRPTAFPVSALVTFSIVESAAASYRDAGAGADAWARHCWLAAGRGTLHQDLYVAPDSLSEAEWAVLAEALAWERAHAHVLARSRMVGGDPGAGEVYGFAARRGGEAVACLRNPSDRPQPLGAGWPELLGGVPAAVRSRYGPPAGETTVLQPFEVLVVEGDLEAPALSPGGA